MGEDLREERGGEMRFGRRSERREAVAPGRGKVLSNSRGEIRIDREMGRTGVASGERSLSRQGRKAGARWRLCGRLESCE